MNLTHSTIVTVIMATTLSTSAMAINFTNWFSDDDITIINTSSKASPATVFSTAYKDAIGAKWYQARNCEDGIKKFNDTKNAVMAYNSSIEFAARNKGLNCTLAGTTGRQTVFIGKTPMHICRLPGSTAEFGNNKTTLGMASMYATKKHQQNFIDNGANVKIIPYSGSKTVLAAIKAGDIDLGWMGSGLAIKQGNNLDCLYSTDPTSTNFLGKSVDVTIPNFAITYVLYTNNEALTDQLRSAKDNDGFNQFLKSSNTSGTFINTQGNINDVLKYVDLMYRTWAD